MIRHVHFQLTLRCNLHCPFCGQHHMRLPEQKMETWLKIAGQLPPGCRITLWGGEPLLYPEFIPLSGKLKEMGFILEVVTNGTLIHEENARALCENFSAVCISLDGGRREHNAVRGEGVFEKVSRNIRLLAGRQGKLLFLSTLHDELVAGGIQWVRELEELKPDAVTLQPLIYLDESEIAAAGELGFCSLDRWLRKADGEYRKSLAETLQKIAQEKYAMPVTPMLHNREKVCCRPDHALHIAATGETCFCTDFTGYSIGNVFRNTVLEVTRSAEAEHYRELFRSNRVPMCSHCPWRSQNEAE